ncbi:hypothetical protein PIB30_061515 [Stylosanthes scabra]|uniref:Uncharacterized protein n=1 Tax=Stylosanthes scabra TaxID=79078 RepID=A0ABU6VL23_9FABA|nr:hypothetical protein [Stylosanthes scabra]
MVCRLWAFHHVTAEHSNIMQHSDSIQTPDQLYIGPPIHILISSREVLRESIGTSPKHVFLSLLLLSFSKYRRHSPNQTSNTLHSNTEPAKDIAPGSSNQVLISDWASELDDTGAPVDSASSPEATSYLGSVPNKLK